MHILYIDFLKNDVAFSCRIEPESRGISQRWSINVFAPEVNLKLIQVAIPSNPGSVQKKKTLVKAQRLKAVAEKTD